MFRTSAAQIFQLLLPSTTKTIKPKPEISKSSNCLKKKKKMLKAERDFKIFKQLIRLCFWVCAMLLQKEFCAVWCFLCVHISLCSLDGQFSFINEHWRGRTNQKLVSHELIWGLHLCIYIYCGITTNRPVRQTWVRDCDEKTVFSLALRSVVWPPLLVQFVLQCGKTATCAPWPIISSWISPSLTCWSPSSACRPAWWWTSQRLGSLGKRFAKLCHICRYAIIPKHNPLTRPAGDWLFHACYWPQLLRQYSINTKLRE